MKAIVFVLLLASCEYCLGQTDTSVLAVGNWSDVVRDYDGYSMRARLLVCDSSGTNKWGKSDHAKVYVDLQHVEDRFRGLPIEIYVNDMDCLRFELRDGFDDPIRPKRSSEIFSISRAVPPPFTLTIPGDSTLRLRADYCLGGSSKADGLTITAPGVFWTIRSDATNEFFLSATFCPPTNHIASTNCHAWKGTLSLPKVKIPVKKP
jgi:hypothetical protein